MKCVLCQSCIDNPTDLGEFIHTAKLSVHYYCLLLAPGLFQRGDVDGKLKGFDEPDIIKEGRRVGALHCFICMKKNANIGCCAKKCRHSFHLHCGLLNGCQPEFDGTFPTYCVNHTAERNGRARPKKDEECGICKEKMGKYNKLSSIWASACCRNGWFHKSCLTQFALSAGYFFKCPLCNNTDQFRNETLMRGIFVPEKDASWELEENAFAELLVRPKICEAIVCCCPDGVEYFDESDEPSDWDFLICKGCGSKSQHRKCAGTDKWICEFCSAFVTANAIADSSSDESENEEVDVEGTDEESVDLRLPFRNNKRRRLQESETEDSPVRPNKRRRIAGLRHIRDDSHSDHATYSSESNITLNIKSLDSTSNYWNPVVVLTQLSNSDVEKYSQKPPEIITAGDRSELSNALVCPLSDSNLQACLPAVKRPRKFVSLTAWLTKISSKPTLTKQNEKDNSMAKVPTELEKKVQDATNENEHKNRAILADIAEYRQKSQNILEALKVANSHILKRNSDVIDKSTKRSPGNTTENSVQAAAETSSFCDEPSLLKLISIDRSKEYYKKKAEDIYKMLTRRLPVIHIEKVATDVVLQSRTVFMPVLAEKAIQQPVEKDKTAVSSSLIQVSLPEVSIILNRVDLSPVRSLSPSKSVDKQSAKDAKRKLVLAECSDLDQSPHSSSTVLSKSSGVTKAHRLVDRFDSKISPTVTSTTEWLEEVVDSSSTPQHPAHARHNFVESPIGEDEDLVTSSNENFSEFACGSLTPKSKKSRTANPNSDQSAAKRQKIQTENSDSSTVELTSPTKINQKLITNFLNTSAGGSGLNTTENSVAVKSAKRKHRSLKSKTTEVEHGQKTMNDFFRKS